ncbi:hypothetical protein [Cohnella herbarum]|uniref:Uncharacterized protein n=1 Tax=Cohnella herbarum TaxID=2728023 RepID=A0A7Z2VJH5_9BACL|nr:hypothetical protein [Cohnella herbarum]QJD84000.1 hypothetical protein HH215_12945 [Cohnella herbarum]
MNMRKNNLSSLQMTKKVNDKYKRTKRVQFANGSTLDIDLLFRPSKRDDLIADLLNLVKFAFENNKKFDASIGIALSTALIIKYFTSLETDAESYDDMLNLIVALKDGEYLQDIITSFVQDELEKIFGDLKRAINLVHEEVTKSNIATETGGAEK